MLTAFWQEARGLQVVQCPAARALDLYFNEAARGGKFAAAMAAADVLHVQIHLRMFRWWRAASPETS